MGTSSPTPDSNSIKATVLVVDDTPENLTLLSDLLKAEGYRVLLAKSGEKALASAQDQNPDLVLLDIMMPEMDGHEVCTRLKGNPATLEIPPSSWPTARSSAER